MRGYINSAGAKLYQGARSIPQGTLRPRIMFFAGPPNHPGSVRGLGVIPAPSIQQVTSLPLSPPAAGIQQTLAQSYGPVSGGAGSWFSGIAAWASQEAISGTGITNGLLYGGAGFLLLLAMLKGRRMF